MELIKSISYFETERPANLECTVELAVQRAVELRIRKLVIFTTRGKGPKLALPLAAAHGLEIIAATSAHGEQLKERSDPDAQPETVGITDPELRKELEANGVRIVSGLLPFQDIFLPGVPDTKLTVISEVLDLIAGGLRLCVQAIIMATEAGYVRPGEDVVAMAADVAIVATGCYKLLLFSPFDGMQIREIICKPRNLTRTKPGRPHAVNGEPLGEQEEDVKGTGKAGEACG